MHPPPCPFTFRFSSPSQGHCEGVYISSGSLSQPGGSYNSLVIQRAAAISQPHLHNALLLPPNAFTVSVHAPLALTIVSPRIIFASMRPTVFNFNLGGKGFDKGALLCALCGSGHFLTAPLHAASPTSATCSLQAALLLFSLQLKSSDALWLAVGTAAVNGTGLCEARGASGVGSPVLFLANEPRLAAISPLQLQAVSEGGGAGGSGASAPLIFALLNPAAFPAAAAPDANSTAPYAWLLRTNAPNAQSLPLSLVFTGFNGDGGVERLGFSPPFAAPSGRLHLSFAAPRAAGRRGGGG